jgi:uncharacterized repeat protein (TIGR01451 family)
MAGATPVLTVQTGSLYASNAASYFSGTGGPFGFSPWTSQFGGVIGSAGLAGESFNDTVYAVAAGDYVTFVIAVQNMTAGALAYDVAVQDLMPAGFIVPVDGIGLSVTDGAGNVIAASGDLFSAAGLTIGAPIAGYDATSGANIALVTFTLQAGPSLPGPTATVQGAAVLIHDAATSGGADLSAANPASASTTIVTASPTPVVTAETDPSAVAKGQTIAFDVTITLPNGTVQDLRINPVLPAGTSMLDFVSTSILSTGANLTLGAPVIGADGSIQFGTVADTAGVAGGDSIVARIVVRADGTASGPAMLQTVVSALNPSTPDVRWSATVANSVGVVVPPPPPVLSGLYTAQRATTTMDIRPFGGLAIADADLTQTGTLAITMSDATAGRMSSLGIGSFDAAGGTYYATGSLPVLQAAAQQVVFTPGAAGAETFTITVVDAAGGVAQDATTQATVVASVAVPNAVQHFAPSPTATFLTATANGQRTLAGGETYSGPVSYLQSQYIYDGPDPVVIVAQTPNVFIKNFVGSAAVALQSGQNVVDAGTGSNFLISGTGSDVFFLDGRSNVVTWNTIVGFHPGDIATLWGYQAGISTYHWDDLAGAAGYQGRTLRADIAGSGSVTASLTFANTTATDTNKYAITTGQVSGINYMEIFAA